LRWEEWEPVYARILKEFGFSRQADELSAQLLDSLLQSKPKVDDEGLAARIGEEVTVCGNGPNLEEGLERSSPRGTLICADGATGRLMDRHYWPALIVTDLDGDIEPQLRANSAGAVMVVHAHGDNRGRILSVVPRIEGAVVGTTQSRPFGRLRNFGGFTDGDRAVELARHFGARRVNLIGFDFEAPTLVSGKDAGIKARKLRWAQSIIFDMNPPQVELFTI
jgi:uncharacterized Rossmann fold enzyme